MARNNSILLLIVVLVASAMLISLSSAQPEMGSHYIKHRIYSNADGHSPEGATVTLYIKGRPAETTTATIYLGAGYCGSGIDGCWKKDIGPWNNSIFLSNWQNGDILEIKVKSKYNDVKNTTLVLDNTSDEQWAPDLTMPPGPAVEQVLVNQSDVDKGEKVLIRARLTNTSAVGIPDESLNFSDDTNNSFEIGNDTTNSTGWAEVVWDTSDASPASHVINVSHTFNHNNSVSVGVWGWSKVDSISMVPDKEEYIAGDELSLECSILDANTSSGIVGYPVKFYMKKVSSGVYDYAGEALSNDSGVAVAYANDTTGAEESDYHVKCNITDNATLHYHASGEDEDIINISILKPPAPVSGLIDSEYDCRHIKWMWSNPIDGGFNHTMIYINGVFETNVSTPYYNAIGLSHGTSYTIRTHTVDSRGVINPIDASHIASTVADVAPPSVSNTTVNGITQITIHKGEQLTLTSEATDYCSNVSLARCYIQKPDGNMLNTLILYDDGTNGDNNASDGTYTALISTGGLGDGKYYVDIEVDDNAGFTRPIDNAVTFTIDDSPPYVLNATPANGTTASAAKPTISADILDDFSGVNASSISMEVDGSPVTPSSITPISNGYRVSYTPTTDFTDDTTIDVSVIAADNLSNLMGEYNWSFIISIGSPSASDPNPPHNSYTNNSTPMISLNITGSEDVDESSITMSVNGVGVTSSTSSFSSKKKMVQYVPITPFEDGTVSVRVEAEDIEEDKMIYIWEFTVDTAPPNITTIPENNSHITDSRPQIIAYITDAGSGVNLGTVVMQVNGEPVQYSNDTIPDGYSIKYTPETALSEGDTVVTVTASDMLGQKTTYTWSFTVDASAGTPEPTSRGGDKVTDTWREITHDKPVTMIITNERIGVIELTIYVKEGHTLVNPTIQIKRLYTKPSAIKQDPPAKTVYKYMEVGHSNMPSSSISSIIIGFKMEKAWLNTNQCNKSNILMMRWNNNAWQNLSTVIVDEDGDYVYYEVESPGLSIFAITVTDNPMAAGVQMRMPGWVNYTATPSATVSITPTPTAVPSATATVTPTPTEGAPLSIMLLILITLIIAIMGVAAYLKYYAR